MQNKKVSRNSIALGLLALIATFSFSGVAMAANPQFNNASNDIKTLVVGSWTTSAGTKDWGNSLSVNAGDRIAFDVYYHNTVDGAVANNTKIKLNYPNSKTSGFTVTAIISADNASQVSDTATINMSTQQVFEFESTAKWYQNEQVSTFQSIGVTNTGTNVTVNLGNVDNKWGHVVFYANVSSYGSGGCTENCGNIGDWSYPTVNAGPDIEIDENQSINLQASAYDSANTPLSYSWTCTGGSLSNNYTLRPVFYAPSVYNDINVVCTITAVNAFTVRASDSVRILVRNTADDYYYYNYTSPLSVTTNAPESVTTNSAVLKATLNNDAGQATSVRFSWGTNSSYTNNSNWITGKHSGNVITYAITGLEAGKAYQYRVEASNNTGNVLGQNVTFVTKPQAPTNLTATPISSSQISLSWNKGIGSCYTKIVRKAYSYPVDANDGVTVFYGYDRSFTNSRLASSTAYYYRAWAIACDQGIAVSDQYSQAYAVTRAVYYPPVTPTEPQSGAILEFLARNKTENENAWQNSVSAKPGDEIEFYVVITPTGAKNLSNVNLRSMLDNDIDSITDLQVNGNDYQGSIGNINIGTAALGESTVVAFKGVIASKDNFNYGNNTLSNTVEVSATNIDTVSKDLDITVNRALEAGAGLSEFLNNSLGLYAVVLTLIVLILMIIVIYLIILRRKEGK